MLGLLICNKVEKKSYSQKIVKMSNLSTSLPSISLKRNCSIKVPVMILKLGIIQVQFLSLPMCFFFIGEVNIPGTYDLREVVWLFKFSGGRKWEEQLLIKPFSFKPYLEVLNGELCQSKKNRIQMSVSNYLTKPIW